MSKNIKSISNPKLKLEILTSEEVKKIHEATLWIIEHVGIRFPSQRALEIWEVNGATVDREIIADAGPVECLEARGQRVGRRCARTLACHRSHAAASFSSSARLRSTPQR